MDIKIFYLSLRNRAKLEKLISEDASQKKYVIKKNFWKIYYKATELYE